MRFQDPDPYGSALVWLPGFGSGSGAVLRKILDPDQH
jgi:hypothetical protein